MGQIINVITRIDVGRLRSVFRCFKDKNSMARFGYCYVSDLDILGISKPTLYAWVAAGLFEITGYKPHKRIRMTHLYFVVIDVLDKIGEFEDNL